MFTVIGLDDENGQVFGIHIAAETAIDAMIFAASIAKRPENLQILGAIKGEHQIETACEDSGNAAYAVDLAELSAL